MKTKCNLDSEMQTATVRTKGRVEMKKKREFETEEQIATVKAKTQSCNEEKA